MAFGPVDDDDVMVWVTPNNHRHLDVVQAEDSLLFLLFMWYTRQTHFSLGAGGEKSTPIPVCTL